MTAYLISRAVGATEPRRHLRMQLSMSTVIDRSGRQRAD